MLSENSYTSRIHHKPALQFRQHRPTDFLLEPQVQQQQQELPLRAHRLTGYRVEDNQLHHMLSELYNSVAMLHLHLAVTGDAVGGYNARLPGMI